MKIDEDILNSIIEYGVKAPSGDNCQPWRFRFDKDRLLIINDEARDTSLYNVRNIASFVAHGALLENMQIAAVSFGYDMAAVLFPKGEKNSVIAAVEFKRSQAKADELFPYIRKRCTNRWPYLRVELEENITRALREEAMSFPGGEVFLAGGEREKKIIAGAASLNDRLLFENRRLHDFLFDHIRWTEKEAKETRDGLDIMTLGLNPVQRRLFKALKSWEFVKTLNRVGLSRLVPMQTYKLIKGSSAVGLVAMKGTSPESFVAGGRLLERVWLRATSLGLSFQPITGSTFLIQRLYLTDGEGLDNAHKDLLLGAEKELKRVFPIEKDNAIIMLFRVGYASTPVLSLRLPAKIEKG
ncbi:MAG: nitroreductase [Deltaproteobacteria bacterium]|nr:nitroreductase [Deltaproteobacteria bacterium]